MNKPMAMEPAFVCVICFGRTGDCDCVDRLLDHRVTAYLDGLVVSR